MNRKSTLIIACSSCRISATTGCAQGNRGTPALRGPLFRRSPGHGFAENIRRNHLTLLRCLLNEFSTIADFFEIVTAEEKKVGVQ